ncbi:MAG: hypothetical protein FWG98_10415 [Candidatus Cloacimonetes bacterium]|nr:hypothetical protein [Candidatus Cloacimonadota bacterium]
MTKSFVLGFNEIHRSGRLSVGNKAFNLSLLSKMVDDINIPKSVVLLSSADVDMEVAKKELLDYVQANIHYPIIARSSTTVEDSAVSFAGLFASEVCYDEKDLDKTIDNVLSSLFAEEVLSYCKFKQIDHSEIKMAVLIQQYISPDISGVIFTKHPVSNDTSIILIEYKEKTSDAVTAGTSIPHSILIKKDKFVLYEPLFEQLRTIALSAEVEFGYPLDLEWILSDEKVWIVQVRQITT